MRAPALAIAWEFRRRHRWGVIGLAGYPLFAVAFKLLILGPDHAVSLDPPDRWAAAAIVPFSALFFYLLAVFSFGFAGDLTARPSIFPSRMFALPISTRALAGWPMLYGTTAMAGLWLTTALLARWPWGIDLPVVWPALLAAVFLAWTQVLAWTAYGLPGVRVIAALLWLTALDVAVVLAVELEVPEPWLVAALAPQLPLAYLCAQAAVARARRGDVPDWRGLFARLGRIADVLPRRRDRLSSPARAQLWFEWRQQGWSLPVWVALLLPFEMTLLLIPGNATPTLVRFVLFAALVTPPFLAAFTAASARTSNPAVSEPGGVTPFIATRPLTSAALVAAKLRTAFRSTMAAWLLVLIAVPLGLTLSGTWPVAIDSARRGVEIFGTPRAVVIALLCLAGLVVSTWTQLVQALSIGLTGRAWLVKASVFLRLSLLTAIVAVAAYILDNRMLAAVWDGLPWIFAVLAAVKMSSAAWIAVRLHRDRLLSDRALVAGAAGWLVAVLALYILLEWILFLPPSMPRHPLALVAILAVPLVRPPAALLALAWNRHRGTRPRAAAESTATVAPRKRVVGAVLVLLGLPVAVALAEAVSYSIMTLASGTIASSYHGREYLVHVPPGYDRARPTPLVISMHGAGSSPRMQLNTSGWNRLADEHGFIVVYPSGAGFPRVFEAQDAGADLTAEVRYFSGLIDTLTAAYNVDPDRIYANGLSNGGGMTFVLACTLSDRLAAVGVVAPALFLPGSWCTDERAVPMVAFHGTADSLTPYHGGLSWVAPGKRFSDIPAWVADWARRNRCAPAPVDSEAAPDVTRRSYAHCADDAEVVLYTVEGGGHTWPGGEPLPEWLAGTTSRSIDATRLMWAFFLEHPRPRERQPVPS